MAKLTDWFPAGVKPAQVGVYQRQVPPGVADYSHWDGTCWRHGALSKDEAARRKDWGGSSYQDFDWRGLSSDPGAKS